MSIIKAAAIAALFVTGLIACSSSVDENRSIKEKMILGESEAAKLPALVMRDANGRTVNLSSFKGKKVFVNLWATWCPPCRAEMPSIEALASKVNGEHAVFVLLSLDENFAVAKSFAKKENLQLPVYSPAEKLPALFKTDAIPATFIFDENGDLVRQNSGGDDYSTNFYVDLLSKN